MYRIVSKWNRFVANTRTIGFVVYTDIYIYISPKRRWSSLAGIKMESLKGGGLFPWFPTTIDDERFSCEMGGREGLLLADGFICLLFFALRGSRSIRSNRWKFAEGQRCFSPFPSSFSSFFFFWGEESATITTDLSDHGLINDAFRLAANKNLLSLLARLDEHPSAIVLRDRTRNFARISSHRHCFLR